MRKMRLLLTTMALVYLALCAALFFFQRRLIYLPQPAGPVPGASTRVMDAGQERLVIDERRHEGAKAVVYLGGNAELVANSLPGLIDAFPDHAIFAMNYRRYGGSTGSPTQVALFADALLLFDEVRKTHSEVTVVGRSLGTGVAVHLASVRPVDRLVLVTPYDSLQELAVARFPYFPVRWLLLDKFESWRDAPAVRAPTVLLLAENDEVIPGESTRRLLSYFAGGVATLTVVGGVGHNTISESPLYGPLLRGEARH